MPSWCRQVNWEKLWDSLSELRSFLCEIRPERTVLRPSLLPVKIAQITLFFRQVWRHTVKSLFNWECIGRFDRGPQFSNKLGALSKFYMPEGWYEVTYCNPENIRRPRRKFCRHGDLRPGFAHLLSQIYSDIHILWTASTHIFRRLVIIITQ
jgi:hypothetical protein